MSLHVDRLPGVSFLAGDDTRPALVVEGDVVDHGRLRALVDERLDELELATRSLVVVSGETSLDLVVTYLALLRGAHVPLLTATGGHALAAHWDASAVVSAGPDGWQLDRRHRRPLELHDDLALLLGTSGSTGAAKLVRLSHENLVANATSIVEFLGLRRDDVGITSLPLHYCYGLSILHSHLLAGASVVLTRASVIDPCFTDAMHAHRVTGLAGVPHSFELLERAGPERVAVPSLRRLTQAGGRMAPERVSEWARRAAAWGAQWFTMYGQTEATARIAYVPPERVLDAPHTIGVAVPGVELHLRTSPDTLHGDPIGPGADSGDGIGELVVRGPNVMLGYANEPTDLALGRQIDELATGDLARRCERTGMWEIVGRRSRLVKPFGLRVDLDDLERRLRQVVGSAAATDVVVVGDDDGIAVVAPAAHHTALATELRSLLAMPEHAWRVADVEVPRTAGGKVAAAELLTTVRAEIVDRSVHASSAADSVVSVFRAVLGRDVIRPDDTFVTLGGDSLSYVECSIRLESLLGTLPDDWHVRRVDAFPSPQRRPLLRRMDTSALLRTAGILAVVATHMGIVFFPGGAHLMLGVVGYNVSRFLLDIDPVRDRLRATGRAVARIALPTMGWTLLGMVLFGAYSPGTLLLVNNYVGPRSHADDHWHFWFVEVLVHLTVVVLALSTVPRIRALERRHRYLTPMVVLGVTLVLRMEWAWMDDWYNLRFRTHGVAFFFVLGWLVHRSTNWRTKLITTVACAAVVPGFFDRPQREWFIIGGLVLLVWCRQVALPGLLVRPVALVAAASMWIYLSHFTIWPALDAIMARELAYPLTILAGVAVWAVARAVEPAVVCRVACARSRLGQRGQAATASPW
jgi:AMP-binding enzyme